MGDIDLDQATQTIRIAGDDEAHVADVVLEGGTKKLAVKADVTVNEILGADPLPDSYFTIDFAGAIGDTVRVQVAATANDSTSPDRDLPAVDVTSTLTATEAGNEQALADLIVSDLNADTNFQNAFLEAFSIEEDGDDGKRAIVHVTSKIFSLNSEFAERPNSGDFAVSVTGTTLVTVAFDTFISRGKPTSLARDPQNPHRLGILGISGSVRVRGENVSDLFFKDAEFGGSNDLTIDGQTTPTTFSVNANAAGGKDIFVEQLKLFGIDTNIKVQNSKFMGQNSALTNGIVVTVTSLGEVTVLPTIMSTADFLARFGTTASDNKIINQSGGDFIEAVFNFIAKNILVQLKAGTSDKIEILIQDDISAVTSLILAVEGFEE